MAEEGKGVALAILGIVAVIAVVGLVLLFTGATGKWSAGGPGSEKLYTRQSIVGYEGGAADVENPYYDWSYSHENIGGVTESRYATGKGADQFSSAGGAWDPRNVQGESPYDASSEPGAYAAPIDPYLTQSPTYKRAATASGQNDACGQCPYGSICELDIRRTRSNWEAVPGFPGCYVVTAHP